MIEAVDAAQAFTASSIDTGPDDDAQAPSEMLGEIDEGFELATGWADVAPAIRELPARERRILYLRFFENKTQSEIRDRSRHLADARLTDPHSHARQAPRHHHTRVI